MVLDLESPPFYLHYYTSATYHLTNQGITLYILGLVVYHFPIEDGMVPTSVSGLNRLLVKIRKRIADGNRVLIHCYGK